MDDIERVAMRLADDYADEFVSLAGRIAITQALRNVREAALEEAATKALEQRCEHGTPWDIACTTIAAEIRALKAVGVNQAAG